MTGEKIGIDDARETDEPLQHFQICGEDRQWKWADAEIAGKDTVVASHPEVPEPVVVRYAWAANPESANLYNKEGLPASLFTTESEIPAVVVADRRAQRASRANSPPRPSPAPAEPESGNSE